MSGLGVGDPVVVEVIRYKPGTGTFMDYVPATVVHAPAGQVAVAFADGTRKIYEEGPDCPVCPA